MERSALPASEKGIYWANELAGCCWHSFSHKYHRPKVMKEGSLEGVEEGVDEEGQVKY